MKQIFKSTGQYFGFIINDYLFSRDAVYLGWIEGDNVWDSNGIFRGKLVLVGSHNYILRNQFTINPIPRVPRVPPIAPVPPIPQANIMPVIIPIGYQDGF